MKPPGRAEIWSIGHWTCPEATFVGLLRSHGIDLVAVMRNDPAMVNPIARASLQTVGLTQMVRPVNGRRKPRTTEWRGAWPSPAE